MQQQDIQQLKSKGISEAQIEKQIQQFQTGFPFLKIEAPASIGKGIIAPTESEVAGYVKAWEDYKASGKKIVKFVPASGAASRMFKDIFSFVDADYDVPTTDFEKKYFADIEKFAFYDALDAACQKNEGKGIKALLSEGNYKAVAANMLKAEGLNYGQLPKGMLLFHKYAEGPRTPMEEHLVEGALYAAENVGAQLAFSGQDHGDCAAGGADYCHQGMTTVRNQSRSTPRYWFCESAMSSSTRRPSVRRGPRQMPS